MRKLENQTGIDNTDPHYLKGKLVDNVTEVGEGINQDIVQFFQKLLDLSGIVASGNPDNENNGYQAIQSLYATVFNTVKVLANGENYTIGENKRTIIVPAGVTSGSVNLGGYRNDNVAILSTGGSGVSINDASIPVTIISSITQYHEYFLVKDLLAPPFWSIKKDGLWKEASQAEAEAGTSGNVVLSARRGEQQFLKLHGGLLSARIPIGDWNMNAMSFKSVDITSVVSDISKLESVCFNVIPDPEITEVISGSGIILIANIKSYSGRSDLYVGNALLIGGKLTVTLFRGFDSEFDNENYDQTDYNRGYVIVQYLP